MVSWLALLVPGVAVFVAYRWWSSRGMPPGPMGWPLIGYLPYLSDNLHESFMNLAEKYGEVFTVPLGGRPLVVLNSCKMIKEAFITQGLTYSGRFSPGALEEYGFTDEIFIPTYSEKWLNAKKFAMQALRSAGHGTPEGMKRIQLEIDDLVSYFEKKGPETPADLFDPLSKCCCNMIWTSLFNKRFSWDDPELELVCKEAVEFLQGFTTPVFLMDGIHPLVKKLKYEGHGQQFKENCVKFTNTIKEKIKEKRRVFDPNNVSDLVDFYIQKRKDDEDFDEDTFASTVRGFIPDSIETGSVQIQWTLLYCTLWPEIQEKMFKEIEEVVGNSRPPQPADRKNMPYTEAVLKEGLRFATMVAVSVVHSTTAESTLNGYRIPVDTAVIANFWSVHYDPEIFPEPDKFKPERFLDENGELKRGDNIMVFSVGRRQCMGEQFIKVQTFLLVTALLQRFKLVFPKDQPKPDVTPRAADVVRRPPEFKVCAIPR